MKTKNDFTHWVEEEQKDSYYKIKFDCIKSLEVGLVLSVHSIFREYIWYGGRGGEYKLFGNFRKLYLYSSRLHPSAFTLEGRGSAQQSRD
ncbi:hypothetical protein BpHYR1_048018 [Brachionus plicatilis]|uniref:Uncharacterized protein n=1 Tax=Brachionus plicatilis TaxID=10195 RepID=A0A3M7T9J2_BRAPC|nr:hypothetical protein BpHYR1_048018 [Brachionus plicatilis]